MSEPKFSNVYDHHQGPELGSFEPSRTKQEFLEESDVNFIVNQYEADGILPPLDGREPIYGDFSDPNLGNYHEALNMVQGAQELFQRLPARVRERFGNDPAELIAFVQVDANRQEAFDLGLLRADYVSPSAPPTPATAPPGAPGAPTTATPPVAPVKP